MKIAFSATLISQMLWGTLFPFHIRAATMCPGITNEDSCISTSDTREDYKSPCVWCCGNVCEPGIGNWACEPLLYLENSSQNWDGNGRTQYGDACGVNNESLWPPIPTFTSDYFFGGPRQIAKATVGRPEAIFISPPTDYSLSFNIEPKSTIGNYASIIHFTTGNNCCEYGTRVPGIFFTPGTTQLLICIGTDVNGDDCSTLPNGLTLHMKHAIEVRVFGSKFSVYVNGELVLEKTIGTRAPLAQVDMYIGTPWYGVADAIISDVSFPTPVEKKQCTPGKVKKQKKMEYEHGKKKNLKTCQFLIRKTKDNKRLKRKFCRMNKADLKSAKKVCKCACRGR